MSVLDSDERKIGIEKYLLVDPPLDLSYALKKIDEWSALKVKFGANIHSAPPPTVHPVLHDDAEPNPGLKTHVGGRTGQ